MSHVPYVNESCPICQWVMSHMSMSHVSYADASCLNVLITEMTYSYLLKITKWMSKSKSKSFPTNISEIRMVSFAEYSLLYSALLQKRPMILRSLLIVSNKYEWNMNESRDSRHRCVGNDILVGNDWLVLWDMAQMYVNEEWSVHMRHDSSIYETWLIFIRDAMKSDQYTFTYGPGVSIWRAAIVLQWVCSCLVVAVWCSVLQCVAVCGSVLQCVAVSLLVSHFCSVLKCVAVCCSVW